MKTLVSGLSAAVRRFPWIVVIVTVIVSVVLGVLSGNFHTGGGLQRLVRS